MCFIFGENGMRLSANCGPIFDVKHLLGRIASFQSKLQSARDVGPLHT